MFFSKREATNERAKRGYYSALSLACRPIGDTRLPFLPKIFLKMVNGTIAYLKFKSS